MNMSLNKNCVVQNFPDAAVIQVGEDINVNTPCSSSPSGTAVVNINRLTEEYYYVSHVEDY